MKQKVRINKTVYLAINLSKIIYFIFITILMNIALSVITIKLLFN